MGIWKTGFEDAANGCVCLSRKETQQGKRYGIDIAEQKFCIMKAKKYA